MFLSIKYNKYLGKDAATGKHLYEYTIIDSDFTGASDVVRADSAEARAAGAVIQEYSKRNLNVAANLFRLVQYLNKTYGFSFEHIFNSWKRHVPEYKKYEEEVQKYLILM